MVHSIESQIYTVYAAVLNGLFVACRCRCHACKVDISLDDCEATVKKRYQSILKLPQSLPKEQGLDDRDQNPTVCWSLYLLC